MGSRRDTGYGAALSGSPFGGGAPTGGVRVEPSDVTPNVLVPPGGFPDVGITGSEPNWDVEVIDLAQKKIIDRDMHHLKRLPDVQYIGVGTTWITDEGLVALADLPKLKEVMVSDPTLVTHTTRAWRDRLRALRPDLQVWCCDDKDIEEARTKRILAQGHGSLAT